MAKTRSKMVRLNYTDSNILKILESVKFEHDIKTTSLALSFIINNYDKLNSKTLDLENSLRLKSLQIKLFKRNDLISK